MDLEAIRADVDMAREASFHVDTDDQVSAEAVIRVIEQHAPALLAEVEYLRAERAGGE